MNYYGNCLKGTNNCFGCSNSGPKVRNFPNVRGTDKGSGQGKESDYNDAPKKNNFFALHSRGDQEISPDVVAGMLKYSLFMYIPYFILVLPYHSLILKYLKSLKFCSIFCMNLLLCLSWWVSWLL